MLPKYPSQLSKGEMKIYPQELQGKPDSNSSFFVRSKTLTIRQLRDYLNEVPEELLENNVNVSDSTAFNSATAVGFYTNGELYVRGG